MTDAKSLRIKMMMQDTGVEDICAAAGISKNAFYRKISGKSEFRQNEIRHIATILHLTGDEVCNIFFLIVTYKLFLQVFDVCP